MEGKRQAEGLSISLNPHGRDLGIERVDELNIERGRDGPDWVSGFQMETDMNFRTATGSWSLRPPVTSVGGMIVGSQ